MNKPNQAKTHRHREEWLPESRGWGGGGGEGKMRKGDQPYGDE